MYSKQLNFSLWADFIEREFLDNEFRKLIADGIINGATSNPAIFKNAILTSPAYKKQLQTLQGMDAKAKYEAMAIYDIQKAATILKPLYEAGDDGYVSIEVDPFLCDDTEKTVEEGKRLYKTIGMQNVMIKVPATNAGYKAMEALSADSIPVNATLVFSKEQALACAKALSAGAQKALTPRQNVISVFVSRIDRALDKTLAQKNIPTGLAGIYNAAAIYNAVNAQKYENCRVLFASTGVKGDDLNPCYYVEGLLAPNSVNTAPIETIKAFVANGKKNAQLPIEDTTILEFFNNIKSEGIDFDVLLQQQIDDGIEAFKIAFQEILENL
jgi:transaldolase